MSQVVATFIVKDPKALEKYDALMKKLPNAGTEKPLIHICSPRAEGGMTIVDVWSSAEALKRFAEGAAFNKLREEVGLPIPEVTVAPVHKATW